MRSAAEENMFISLSPVEGTGRLLREHKYIILSFLFQIPTRWNLCKVENVHVHQGRFVSNVVENQKVEGKEKKKFGDAQVAFPCLRLQ